MLDLRGDDAKRRIIRGSHRVVLAASGEIEVVDASARSWMGKTLCLYGADVAREDHPVAQALISGGSCRELLLLSEPFADFEAAFPMLCSKASSSKAGKRPLCPSCVLPGLLYLGDLTDAAALPRLREQLNIQQCLTALAELTPSLKASVAESGVRHTWCNVRDVEEADIKAHFDTSFERIEAAREAGTAIFVHCSRGVSRSASLCIAYLMRKEGWTAQRAREHVAATRPIILPNEGFWRCLCEYEKELKGERSGVYVPLPKAKPLEESDFELPPSWAAEPSQLDARLSVSKGADELESLPIGDHMMYTFGRSLTCDFQLDHPSISRQHAALVHHENGGLYVIDLKSSHTTSVNGKPIKPYEATLLKNGSSVSFGASSRSYRLEGIVPPPDPAAAQSAAPGKKEAVAGPQLPGAEAKRKWTPADAKAKKRQKWLGNEKPRSKMTENERVAMGAGSGSGCFGPGFD